MAAEEVKSVKVAMCQLLVGKDKAANLDNAAKAVDKAASQGAVLVLLPEMFNCPYSNDSFGPYSETIPSTADEVDKATQPSSYAIINMAKKNNIYLVAGSIPEKEDSRLYNTCLVIDPKGQIIAKHRKVHLFDIDIPGKMTFKESDTLSPGNDFTMADTPYGKLGIGICYDLRFAEYAQVLTSSGCTILCYPGAFNTVTGPVHWELLQRARALDNQVFVVTCSPARNPESKYQAWGHSTVVDPWGQVVETTSHEEAIIIAELNLPRVTEVRKQIPIGFQKRSDLYAVYRFEECTTAKAQSSEAGSLRHPAQSPLKRHRRNLTGSASVPEDVGAITTGTGSQSSAAEKPSSQHSNGMSAIAENGVRGKSPAK